jgi:hypothetical protein
MEADQRHRLARQFERSCRVSKNPRGLQCSSEIQRKLQARSVGRNPKDSINVAAKLKKIVLMDNWRVSRHIDFVRNCIQNMLGRCQRIRKVIALTTSDALCDCRFGWRPPSQGFDHNARLVHVRPRQDYSIPPRRRTLTFGSDAVAMRFPSMMLVTGFTSSTQRFALRKWRRLLRNCSNVMYVSAKQTKMRVGCPIRCYSITRAILE